MKKLTIIINDDELYSALEDEAASSNRTVEEVAIDAIKLWKMDSELDAEERVEVEAAIKDWKKNGGVEAGAFFDSLRNEERSAADR